ncbi:hypothetical protein NLR03_24035, partial [Escherichia coli]|nr:hypothetical protein [Escherichia coli]
SEGRRSPAASPLAPKRHRISSSSCLISELFNSLCLTAARPVRLKEAVELFRFLNKGKQKNVSVS